MPLAVGVGNDPDSIPSVRSANGGSGYTMPFSIIPERSDFPEDGIQSARAKGRNIFDDDPARPDFRDDTAVFLPETGTGAAKPGAFAGEADVLAGEAASNDIDDESVQTQTLTGKRADIFVDRNTRPLLFEHGATIGLNLAHGSDTETSALKSKFKPSDAAK